MRRAGTQRKGPLEPTSVTAREKLEGKASGKGKAKGKGDGKVNNACEEQHDGDQQVDSASAVNRDDWIVALEREARRLT